MVHEERVSGVHQITLQRTTDSLYLIGHWGAQWAEQDTLFVLVDPCFILFPFLVGVVRGEEAVTMIHEVFGHVRRCEAG